MATRPLDVVVVGGSLAGLMHGTMIKRLGHNVRILEQYPTSTREGQAAGMSTGVYGQEFLKKHDRIQDRPHFVTASYLRIVDVSFNLTELHPVPFRLTNWKTLYYRLRANFDGMSSEYVLVPPRSLPTDGTVVYDVGKRVKDVSYAKESGLTITSEDVVTGASTSLHPDLIIAADGANSTIRQLLLPELEAPYSGYLTWRGVIPEKSISEESLNFLHDSAIRYYTDGSYIVVYKIPGEDGNITRGERHVNLVWYYNCAKDSIEYTAAMTDIDGLQHRRTVPFGKVQPDVWAKQQAYSSTRFAAPIKEMVDKIDKPFVTAISDCISPRCSFYDGKLFLVGDALALFRPHVAQSTNQSALHCLLLEKLLQRQINLATYEKEVMMFAHTTLLGSREIGSQYLYSPISHIYHKMHARLARKGKLWGVRL